jgi:hypothetical protein
MASCQAVMLPLAGSRRGSSRIMGCTVLTVSAGLATAGFLSSAALDGDEIIAVAQKIHMPAAIKKIAY